MSRLDLPALGLPTRPLGGSIRFERCCHLRPEPMPHPSLQPITLPIAFTLTHAIGPFHPQTVQQTEPGRHCLPAVRPVKTRGDTSACSRGSLVAGRGQTRSVAPRPRVGSPCLGICWVCWYSFPLYSLRQGVTEQRIREAHHNGIAWRKVREQFGDGEIIGVIFALAGQSSSGTLLANLNRST
jgi:hypothetical protein